MSENKNPFFTEDDNDAKSGEVKDENTEKGSTPLLAVILWNISLPTASSL